MARREIETPRTSIRQVADQSTGIYAQAAEIGQDIIRVGQEAKINENLSKAQLEVNQLDKQYQVDFEHDPMNERGIAKLRSDKNKIYKTYGDQISPMFKRPWMDGTREISTKNDATQEIWAFKQTQVNSVKSINSSMEAMLSQAVIDGQNIADGKGSLLDAIANFELSKKRLAETGYSVLGKATTDEQLKHVTEDATKMLLSGVAEKNPISALKMLDNEGIKDSFSDQSEYLKMKKAIEARALNMQEIEGQRQVLGALKNENSLLAKSLEKPLGYAEVVTQTVDMNKWAQKYFMKANGYTKKGVSKKLDAGEKLQARASLYEDLESFTGGESSWWKEAKTFVGLETEKKVTSESVAKFQERIYESMATGVINDEQGATLLSQLVTPLVNQKEEELESYSDNAYFSADIGLKGLKRVYRNNIEIPLPKKGKTQKSKARYAETKALNDANKVKLYDYYMTALKANTESYKITMGELQKLPTEQKRKIMGDAQEEAQRLYLLDKQPALSTLTDIPNQIFAGGKLIQGVAGNRDLKPDFSTKGQFVILEKNGHKARRYSDGTIEVLN
ncbi:hypothetical protein KAR91_59825 [Candidatus Pacearchaeota archaeon]|nr:hypothetical protein [Candidatus Pacearchaeota archaeon]